MKDDDVLFCRKAVVNRLSDTIGYYISHPESEVQGQDASFLSSLFVDVNLTEITQQKTIYFQTSLHELPALPLQNNIHMVVFLNGSELSPIDIESLLDFRLQGHQFGIINPNLEDFPSDFFDVFSYVLFDLKSFPYEEVIKASEHPFISSKIIWIHKIESSDQFDELKGAIPDGQFSGSSIHKITPVKGKRILAYKAILIDLLVALNRRESSPRVLAEYIERDPTLTYRIIKLTYTAIYRSYFNVANAQRAIEIIGIRDLIKWVSLVMLGSVPGKPDCLFSMAVTRACFCQNLSAQLFPKLDGAFLVGLFSYLPSFLGEELILLLMDLPLEENIKTALLEYKGNLGSVLKIVENYEAGRWEKIPFEQLESQNISKHSLKEIYIKSLKEARQMGNV